MDGVAPEEERMNYVRKVCELPHTIKPFAIIACGYPREDKEQNYFFDRYREERVHFENY